MRGGSFIVEISGEISLFLSQNNSKKFQIVKKTY
jgi:hypothetical protein